MLILLMIVCCVLIGLAYADLCLIDNTAHFGICYTKVADAEVEPGEDGTAVELRSDAWDHEREAVVPPAVGVIDIAAARSESRNATIPRVSSADAGVVAIGT